MLRADRAARPRFVLDAEILYNSWDVPVLRVMMLNERDRDALRATLKIYVPDKATVRPCANEEGHGSWAIPPRWGAPPEPHPEALPGTSWHVFIVDTDLPVNTPTDAFFVKDALDDSVPAVVVLEHGAAERIVSMGMLE